MDTHQGSCLCGEITFEVTGQPVRQGNCHCSTCKKATGAAYATIVFFKEDQISQLSGETKSYESICRIKVIPRERCFAKHVVLLSLAKILVGQE